jgi:hypothetical protein
VGSASPGELLPTEPPTPVKPRGQR